MVYPRFVLHCPPDDAVDTRTMKIPTRLFAVSLTFAIAAIALAPSYGQDSNFKPPGTEEQATVDRANGELDKVYKQLMAKLDADQQKTLKEAQRAWIKWRDAEADIIARLGGAIGGSAMRVDYANAQAKLIKERTEVLRGYLKETGRNR
jgi:uncharacterized protein YecT (DUF1311 family)